MFFYACLLAVRRASARQAALPYLVEGNYMRKKKKIRRANQSRDNPKAAPNGAVAATTNKSNAGWTSRRHRSTDGKERQPPHKKAEGADGRDVACFNSGANRPDVACFNSQHKALFGSISLIPQEVLTQTGLQLILYVTLFPLEGFNQPWACGLPRYAAAHRSGFVPQLGRRW
jgi:hypothetical protein